MAAEISDAFAQLKGSVVRGCLRQSRELVGIVAIFGGQWPHSSYMLPGGVSQPANNHRLMDAADIVASVRAWFEESVLGATCTIFLPWTMPNRCSAGLKPTRVDAPPHSR